MHIKVLQFALSPTADMFILAVKFTPRTFNTNRVRLSFGIARSDLARSGIARSDLVATHAYRLD